MTPRPLISVLVPVRNSALYLGECIESIQKQTYDHLQIVLVDDNSTDSSLEICARYRNFDSRIVVYRNESSGIAAARQMLLDKAEGDFIIYIDSDDWIDPCMIETLWRHMIDFDLDLISSKVKEEKNRSRKGYADCINILTKEEGVACFLDSRIQASLCVKLVKTAIYRQVNFNPEISYGEDLYMTWLLLNRCTRIGLSDKSYYHYRQNPNSLSHQNFSASTVGCLHAWSLIEIDCARTWPTYTDKVHVCKYHCIIWLLYHAARSGYKRDSIIRELQEYLLHNKNISKAIRPKSAKRLVFEYIALRNYCLLESILSKLPI